MTTNITNNKSLLPINIKVKRKSLGEILKEKYPDVDSPKYSYKSHYIQEFSDYKDYKQYKDFLNYKRMHFGEINSENVISNINNINISPKLKSNLCHIKNQISITDNKRLKANSIDLSLNFDSKSLEKSFSRKLSIESNSKVEKNKIKSIKIYLQIIEPYKASFSVNISKKTSVALLKKKICETLALKNKNYNSLTPNSFLLMKNYCFVSEFGTIGDTILSDRDKVYIILKESMEKCHDNKEKEESSENENGGEEKN